MKFNYFLAKYYFIILAVIIPLILCGEDYYKLLNVKRDATTEELRKSFKSNFFLFIMIIVYHMQNRTCIKISS